MKIPWLCRIVLFVIPTMLFGCQNPTPPVQETPSPTPTLHIESTPNAGVLVDLTAPDTALGVGDTLEVTVEINQVENLMGAEVHLQFDPRYLQIEDAEPETEGVQVMHGEFLQPGFVAINTSDNESGKIDYAIAQMPSYNAVNGSGTLFTMRVRATALGSPNIILTSVVLADASAQQIPTTSRYDTLTITIE